jgi:hypothetical protein
MKIVQGTIYLHKNYVHILPSELKNLIHNALQFIPRNFEWNIVAVNPTTFTIKFLFYPKFDADPHPALKQSLKIDLKNKKVNIYLEKSSNPPILHRKETFIEPDYPYYEIFRRLTEAEEKVGLYTKTLKNRIGRKKFWEKLLNERGIKIEGHKLIVEKEPPQELKSTSNVFRKDKDKLKFSALTAISRSKPSFPTRLAVEKKLIHGNVFDYGCGRGRDVLFLRELGFKAEGWDPYYNRNTPLESFPKGYFHWIQCIYVLNTVLEDTRRSILSNIFSFLPSGGHLYLAVRTFNEIEKHAYSRGWKKYLDGWITKRETFQKGFTYKELISLIKEFEYKNIRLLHNTPLILLADKS